ncbi:BNR-4 repeat-containing protein [Caldithrix abyssi]
MSRRDLSRIKRRLYRVLFRDPQKFSEPTDPRIEFDTWLATFSELGYCEAGGISSKIEPVGNVLLDNGKNKSYGFKGTLSGTIIQTEISDFETFAAIENVEIDFLLYDEKSGFAIFFPKALVDFKEEAKGGEIEKVAFEYQGENLAAKESFRIRFNAQTGAGGIPLWFDSNVQNFSDMFTGIGSPVQSTHFYHQPEAYYFKGSSERIYFAFITDSDNPNTNITTCYVAALNLSDLSLIGPVDVGPSKAYAEQHHQPAIIVADDGHILVAYDRLNDAETGHNGGIRIMRSNNPEDISNGFTQIKVLEGEGSYPYLFKKNGILYCGFRERDSLSLIPRWVRWAKSTDHGQTWESAFRIMDVGGGDNIWAYGTRPWGKENDWLYILMMPEDRSLSNPTGRYVLYVLKTRDGQTFYNMDESFKKDVKTNGYLTKAELDTYFEMERVTHPVRVYHQGGYVTRSNELILMTRIIFEDSSSKYYLQWFDGKHWVKREIDNKLNVAWAYFPHIIIAHDMNNIDLILRKDDDKTLHRFRTTDRGLTWTYKGQWPDLGWGTDSPIYPNPQSNIYDYNRLFYLLSIRPASGSIGKLYAYLWQGVE